MYYSFFLIFHLYKRVIVKMLLFNINQKISFHRTLSCTMIFHYTFLQIHFHLHCPAMVKKKYFLGSVIHLTRFPNLQQLRPRKPAYH